MDHGTFSSGTTEVFGQELPFPQPQYEPGRTELGQSPSPTYYQPREEVVPCPSAPLDGSAFPITQPPTLQFSESNMPGLSIATDPNTFNAGYVTPQTPMENGIASHNHGAHDALPGGPYAPQLVPIEATNFNMDAPLNTTGGDTHQHDMWSEENLNALLQMYYAEIEQLPKLLASRMWEKRGVNASPAEIEAFLNQLNSRNGTEKMLRRIVRHHRKTYR